MRGAGMRPAPRMNISHRAVRVSSLRMRLVIGAQEPYGAHVCGNFREERICRNSFDCDASLLFRGLRNLFFRDSFTLACPRRTRRFATLVCRDLARGGAERLPAGIYILEFFAFGLKILFRIGDLFISISLAHGISLPTGVCEFDFRNRPGDFSRISLVPDVSLEEAPQRGPDLNQQPVRSPRISARSEDWIDRFTQSPRVFVDIECATCSANHHPRVGPLDGAARGGGTITCELQIPLLGKSFQIPEVRRSSLWNDVD